ncbi:MAG TPA: hypothetical protein VKB93_12365 [Thermoanaerobaculia bacterium]|nr:hypothetical protein [Thermoanaerobaculia bacterium]
MRRLLILAVLVLLAVQPAYCHCPLQDNETSICPACSLATTYVIAVPVLSAPVVLAYQLSASAATPHAIAIPVTVSPRAPPLAS